MRAGLALAVLLSVAAQAADEELFPPPAVKVRARAVRATLPLKIDGRLDEKDWELARPLEGFTQVEPNQGAPPTLRTTVRVLFDEHAVYFGARCEDPLGPAGIRQRDLRRDFDWVTADGFAVILDTLADGRNAFAFGVNVWGAQADLQVIDDQLFESNWDAVWSSAVTRDAGGWTAELALPWKSLRRAPGRTEWGLQILRGVRRLNEDDSWTRLPRSMSPFRMSYAGLLEGLEPPENGGLNVQLRPYGIIRTGRTGADPFRPQPTAGGEVTWSPSANSVLDLTANTDFAETDVDRRVVNLGRFSVFFPEKRQFFLENAGVFSSGDNNLVQPFFSRAIGLADDQRVPINAGGRFVTRSADRSFGALVVNTAPLDANAGSLFGVTRYSQNLGGDGVAGRLGGMLVARHDFEHGAVAPVTNVVPVVDGMARAGPVMLNAMVSGSGTAMHDGSPAQLGLAGSTSASLQGNWGMAGASVSAVGPGYDARAGFVSRSEVWTAGSFWFLDVRPKWLPWWIRSLHQYGEVQGVWSTRDGSFQEAYAYLEPIWFRTPAGDKAWLSAQHAWQRLSDSFDPVPGVLIPPGFYEYDTIGFSAYSEPSRVVSGGGTVKAGRYYRARYLNASAQAGVQPLPHIALAVTYNYNRFDGEGVIPGGTATHLLAGEARLAVSPRLQLIGSYQRDTAGNVGLLNARIAWEFLPLSFVYVVFTDSRAAFSAADAPVSEQQLVVKVTYTWRP